MIKFPLNNNISKFSKQLLITLIILLLAIVISLILMKSKKSVKKHVRQPKLSKVICIKATPVPHTVFVKGFGTVEPDHEIDIVSEVSGKIQKISKNFVNGGSFKKNEILIQIDPEDYLLSLSSARAKVKDAESKYALAKEESYIAKQEWIQVHGKNSDRKLNPLVAKVPQLEAAFANLQANRAEQKKIELFIEKCTIKAPFNGRVSMKKFDQAQYISKGQTIGTIFSTDSVEISVSLQNDELRWIDVPGFTTKDEGSNALVKANAAGTDKTWPGYVARSLGKVDVNTRLVNVIINVKNPYSDYPPLAAGLFTEVLIEGKTIDNVFEVPTDSVRDGSIVWVVDQNNILRFRKVNALRNEGNNVIIDKGLNPGDLVVVSNLKLVANGMKVTKIVKDAEK